MIARISLSVMLASCVLWPSALSAQWGADSTGGYAAGAPVQWAGGSAPPGGPVPFANGYAPQAGLDHYGDGSGFYAPPGMGYGPGHEPLPWEREGMTPLKAFFAGPVATSYFRVEYLSWDVDDVGAGGIGGEHQFLIDQRNRIPNALFDVDLFQTRDFLIPSTEPITFNRTSGVRATYGLPLSFGVFEFSGFMLDENNDGISNAIPGPTLGTTFTVPANTFIVIPPSIQAVVFPFGAETVDLIDPNLLFVPEIPLGNPEIFATLPFDQIAPGTIFNVTNRTANIIPLTQNGAPALTALVFDVGYEADYDSKLWGTEAKLMFEYGPNFNSVSIRPLVGFRYMSFDERFRQVGFSSFTSNIIRGERTAYTVDNPLFDPIGPTQILRPGPVRASIIDSETENTLFGVQAGTRIEYEHKWFTLGVEPKISLGLNSYEAQVTTINLRNASDGVVRTSDDDLTFAPVFDVAMYGKVHLTPYFSLHAGYNFTYLFQVTRPVDNIVYNDNGPNAPPGVVLDTETVDMHIQGLTIGGEFRFRDLKLR